MRAVVQRVLEASVYAKRGENLEVTGQVGKGFLVLLGVRNDDTPTDARYLAEKVANLRIFEDNAGKLNRSLLEIGGGALVVSNFTLYGDARSGRRPSFTLAAAGTEARTLYESFGQLLEGQGVPVQYGAFGEEMRIHLVNDGPLTILLDSRKEF